MRNALKVIAPHRFAPDAGAAAPATTAGLKGLVTAADLPQAEREWPGLQAFYRDLPRQDRPGTFLELVWQFERSRDKGAAAVALAA